MIKHPFYDLLSQYVTVSISNKTSKETVDELYQQMLNMIEDEVVTSVIVVQSLSDIYSRNLSHYLFIIQIMRSVYYTSQIKGGYLYPEFFWIIVKNNTFYESNNISDMIASIVEFCDYSILRGYLTYLLMTTEESNQKSIIKSFYHVGYTVETLKVVIQTVLINERNIELYNYIYMNAVSFVFSERAKLLSIEEKGWLQDFFTSGLNLGHVGINESCQKALKKLTELT